MGGRGLTILRRVGERKSALLTMLDMIGRDLPRQLAAAVIGVHRTTLARWRRREEQGEPVVYQRGPGERPVGPATVGRVASLVRELRGLVGAESLRRSIGGLSRRAAARIKRDTLTQMERDRRAEAQHVTVTEPGVLRGFDAMVLSSDSEIQYLLVAADGSVPYRTSWATVPCYDGRAVAAFLERDLRQNGAPLVLRLDRARQHATQPVLELLASHKVLLLHGPAHRATFYGQLEPQNREHRGWLAAPGDASQSLQAMIDALNSKWRRSTLGWRTAAEAWIARRPLSVDRAELQEEVKERAARVRHGGWLRGKPADFADRVAIEQALTRRGLLRREIRGWC